MEIIVNNPGLQHLAENILLNLDHHDLEICQGVNTSFKKILNNPRFWLRKFIRRGLSMKNQLDWIKAIRLTKDTDMEKLIVSYLQKSSQNSRVIDLPCYIDEEFLTKFDDNEFRFLRDITNASDAKYMMFHAIAMGELVHVKILALFAENPNAPDENGETPIHIAACQQKHSSYTDIVSFKKK